MNRFFLIALLSAYTANAQPTQNRVLKASDNNAYVVVASNERLTIELEVQSSTGMTWDVDAIDGHTLMLASREHVASGVLGGNDKERLSFVGVAAGRGFLSLVCRLPWRSPSVNDQRFVINADVLGPFVGVLEPQTQEDYLQQGVTAQSGFDAKFNLCGSESDDYSQCTPVKNQGGCGSCWAFATNAVVENLVYLTDKRAEHDFSEQYLVSCNSNSWGCHGGGIAFDYYIDKHLPSENSAGVVYASDFPYQARDVPCGVGHKHNAKLVRWDNLNTQNGTVPIDTIKKALTETGPVWVTVCADTAFKSYRYYAGRFGKKGSDSSDIFHGAAKCANHAVVIVGWNDNAGDGYWIVRNSWGQDWGDNGYMRLAYGANYIGIYGAKAIYGPYQRNISNGCSSVEYFSPWVLAIFALLVYRKSIKNLETA